MLTQCSLKRGMYLRLPCLRRFLLLTRLRRRVGSIHAVLLSLHSRNTLLREGVGGTDRRSGSANEAEPKRYTTAHLQAVFSIISRLDH